MSAEEQSAVRGWFERHGIETNDVYLVEQYEEVNAVHIYTYRRGSDGKRYFDRAKNDIGRDEQVIGGMEAEPFPVWRRP